MSGDYLTAEIAEEAGVITETIEVPTGEGPAEKQIDVYEASVEELAELEDIEDEVEDDDELLQRVFDDYLAKPSDLSAEDIHARTQDAIFRGILRAWGASDDAIEQALDELQGN